MTAVAFQEPQTLRPHRDEALLVSALQHGDEAAFVALVDRYSQPMLRVAQIYVRSRAVAEEVVQETWVAVLSGIGRFEQRSSVRTWIFRILTNRAKSRGEREARTVPFSALSASTEEDGPTVDPDRFLPATHPQWPGHWASPPTDWRTVPEERLLGRETVAQLKTAIAHLPERQRMVLVLRDVEGWSPEEVCCALELSENNQRVLLHRARAKLRTALEAYMDMECAA